MKLSELKFKEYKLNEVMNVIWFFEKPTEYDINEVTSEYMNFIKENEKMNIFKEDNHVQLNVSVPLLGDETVKLDIINSNMEYILSISLEDNNILADGSFSVHDIRKKTKKIFEDRNELISFLANY